VDASQAFDSTWHYTVNAPGDSEPHIANLSFTGSAIYVFFILAGTGQPVATSSNLTFILDGEEVRLASDVTLSGTYVQYNTPVYVNETLSNGPHQLTIQMMATANSSIVLFDYAVYTADADENPSSSAASPSPSTTSSTDSSNSDSGVTLTSSSHNDGRVNALLAVVVVFSVLAGLAMSIGSYWVWRRRRSIRAIRADPANILNAAHPIQLDARSTKTTSRFVDLEAAPLSPSGSGLLNRFASLLADAERLHLQQIQEEGDALPPYDSLPDLHH